MIILLGELRILPRVAGPLGVPPLHSQPRRLLQGTGPAVGLWGQCQHVSSKVYEWSVGAKAEGGSGGWGGGGCNVIRGMENLN